MDRPQLDKPLKPSEILPELSATTDEELREGIGRLIKAANSDDRRRRVQRIQPAGSPLLAPSGARCWALRPPDTLCDCGAHYERYGQPGRPCPARTIARWSKELSKLLADFGIAPGAPPSSVADRLRASFQGWRPVKVRHFDQASEVPLSELMPLLGRAVPQLVRRQGYFHGAAGTGKSFAMAYLFFAALEAGIDADWVDDLSMRRLVVRLESFDEATKKGAEAEWERLTGRKVIFYNDLCVDEDPPRESKPGHPLLGPHLWRLTEESRANLWVSSNLGSSMGPEEDQRGWPAAKSLNTHPDCGARVVSRLLADRQDLAKLQLAQDAAVRDKREITQAEWTACIQPALILNFVGENQRLAGLSMARLAATQKNR
jgi:hypothetical protein